MTLERCPWCGAEFESIEAPTHEYVEASPSCWSAFNVLLGRINSDLGYRSGLIRFVSDSYNVQHPGKEGKESSNSVAIHMIGLMLMLEMGYNGKAATRRMEGIFRSRKDHFIWLEPPSFEGCLNITHVLVAKDVDDMEVRAEEWGRSVLKAWRDKHGEKLDAML